MAHGTEVNQATGTPQKVLTLDRTENTWPAAADGEMPASVLYQGATPDALSPVNDSNPLAVDDAGGSLTVDDGGGSLTVDGPLTDAQLRASAVPVSAATLPLPTGAATLAEQQTQTTVLQLLDDTVSADNGNATKGVVGMHYDGSKHHWNRGDGVNLNVKVNTALPAGTNNIGDVDVLTQPARSATVDAIAAAIRTGVLMSGLTELTVKFAKVDTASSGDNTIVAAVTSKKIRVLKYRIIPASDVAVTWKSGAGTSLTGAMSLAGKAGDSGAEAMLGHFETASGAALVLNLGGAVQVSGYVVYVEV